MKVAILGAGGIGCLFGARVLDQGHDVHFIARGRHLEVLQESGLRLHGHSQYQGEVQATDLPGALATRTPFDVVFVTTKAHQTASVAEAAHQLAPDGILVTLQNGLGNGQKLAMHHPSERVVGALTSEGVTVQAPGMVRHAGQGETQVAPHAPGEAATEAAKEVHGLLDAAGFHPTVHEDLRGITWRKAIVNHAINTVATIYDCTNGELFDDDAKRFITLQLAQEAWDLSKHARVQLPPGTDPPQLAMQVLIHTRENVNSMLQDVRAKRPTEIEQISGRMVRLGEQLLVSMPRSDFIYGKLKDLEQTYLGSQAMQMAWEELPYAQTPF